MPPSLETDPRLGEHTHPRLPRGGLDKPPPRAGMLVKELTSGVPSARSASARVARGEKLGLERSRSHFTRETNACPPARYAPDSGGALRAPFKQFQGRYAANELTYPLCEKRHSFQLGGVRVAAGLTEPTWLSPWLLSARTVQSCV